MLIVLSNPSPVAVEAHCINQLFEAGLQYFHLRRPACTAAAIAKLLQAIDPAYYPRIVLHQYHAMAAAWGIQRLHFTEAIRRSTSETYRQTLVAAGYQLSTSVHTVVDYHAISSCFGYAFIGPVFNSISKAGYRAENLLAQVQALGMRKTPLVALGGIDAGNCRQPAVCGFDGVALLGAIWLSGDPLSSFKKINKIYVQ